MTSGDMIAWDMYFCSLVAMCQHPGYKDAGPSLGTLAALADEMMLYRSRRFYVGEQVRRPGQAVAGAPAASGGICCGDSGGAGSRSRAAEEGYAASVKVVHPVDGTVLT